MTQKEAPVAVVEAVGMSAGKTPHPSEASEPDVGGQGIAGEAGSEVGERRELDPDKINFVQLRLAVDESWAAELKDALERGVC